MGVHDSLSRGFSVRLDHIQPFGPQGRTQTVTDSKRRSGKVSGVILS
jgi:hypothetical protein